MPQTNKRKANPSNQWLGINLVNWGYPIHWVPVKGSCNSGWISAKCWLPIGSSYYSQPMEGKNAWLSISAPGRHPSSLLTSCRLINIQLTEANGWKIDVASWGEWEGKRLFSFRLFGRELFLPWNIVQRGEKVNRKKRLGEEKKWIPIACCEIAGFEKLFWSVLSWRNGLECKKVEEAFSILLLWQEINIVDYLDHNCSPKACPRWWQKCNSHSNVMCFVATLMLFFLFSLFQATLATIT